MRRCQRSYTQTSRTTQAPPGRTSDARKVSRTAGERAPSSETPADKPAARRAAANNDVIGKPRHRGRGGAPRGTRCRRFLLPWLCWRAPRRAERHLWSPDDWPATTLARVLTCRAAFGSMVAAGPGAVAFDHEPGQPRSESRRCPRPRRETRDSSRSGADPWRGRLHRRCPLHLAGQPQRHRTSLIRRARL